MKTSKTPTLATNPFARCKRVNHTNATASSKWLRLPLGRCRCCVTGLSRSSIYRLITPHPSNGYAPPVKSIVVKKRHTQRGVRLISTKSLLDYLDALAEEATLNREQKWEESLTPAQRAHYADMERRMEASWEPDPEVPDLIPSRPLSVEARKRGLETFRKMAAKRNGIAQHNALADSEEGSV